MASSESSHRDKLLFAFRSTLPLPFLSQASITRSCVSKECQAHLPHQREPSANPYVFLLRRTRHAASPATHLSIILTFDHIRALPSTTRRVDHNSIYANLSIIPSQQLQTFIHPHPTQWPEARARALEGRPLAQRTQPQSLRSRTAQRPACK